MKEHDEYGEIYAADEVVLVAVVVEMALMGRVLVARLLGVMRRTCGLGGGVLRGVESGPALV